MNIFQGVKFAALIALVLSIAVGCASTPEPEPEDQRAIAEQAIADAKAANERAKDAGAEWRDTEELIKQAEEAFAAEDYPKAIELANQARRQAENALRQHQAEMNKAKPVANDGYTVMSGDTLWGISSKSSIYGNPYQWPLIYKANRSQIKDADLIYPGQNLVIQRDASAAEIDAAVNHARNRGAWSIGVVESSDEAYLSR
ncbi:MAG: LysM peptidoglycan-binding domain-containing protein [Chromatiales bacterium]|nr:LysM peptidoglycan-binding domain-containing protein [Chromatiales bacterium]